MTHIRLRSIRGLAAGLVAVLLLVALVLPAAAKEQRAHGQGRLFKVTAAGIAPSHVFGTMHSTDPEILTLPSPVARAFGSCSRLVLELVFTPETEARMGEAMVLRDGRTLADIAGPALYGKLVTRAVAYGLPSQQISRLKPWAASLIFSVPASELDRSASGVLALDRTLQQAADARGTPVFGLESLKEQIAAFSGASESEQVEGLRLTLDLNPGLDATFAEMKEAYLAGDFDRLHAMAQSMYAGQNPRLAKQFEQQFIEDRNKRMASRVVRHVKQGDAFIAVGALHLSGDSGILRLLEARGYKVTRAY